MTGVASQGVPDAPRGSTMLRWAVALTIVAIVVAGAFALFEARQKQTLSRERAAQLTGGDPARGPALAVRYGCAACHAIKGVRGPQGKVGPPLDAVAARVYIAGRLPNTPENLVKWIADPRGVDPRTAMPQTGISQEEARDVAAYLISLR